MKEQRREAYINLINGLLSCPSGEEPQILNANPDLVDAGFVQTMVQVAEVLEEKGDRNAADFLIDVARQLAKVLGLSSSTPTSSTLPNSESQLSFFLQVLLITADSNGNPQVVYPLLQENLDQLDDNFAQVLRSWASATLPEVEPKIAYDIAGSIGDFSALIQQFPLGNRASNLEIAIICNEIVTTVFTREAFPEDWARTQNNLGIEYRNRLRGERAENLEASIRCFLAALEVRTRDSLPEQWATTQNNLGGTFMYRLQGQRAENLEAAIRCFSAALEVRTRDFFPQEWAGTQNNLGLAYLYRIWGEKAENLEAAIHCFSEALEIFTRKAVPQEWADTQINLANAYLNRIWRERVENLEAAIHCFSEALEVYTREAFPYDWAETKNKLGIAYIDLRQGERAENLEAAIRCFSEALEIYTREAFPSNWADTKNKLGVAYLYRIQGGRAENLEIAIRCFSEALEYTRQDFPYGWAAIQINLGAAYKNRVRGERAENIEAAIGCFLAASKICTREDFPQEWGNAQNNLGNAYRHRIWGEQAENVEAAIRCFLAALEVRTREAFPYAWAETQNNLGATYRNRLWGERAENLETAIYHFLSALEVYTRSAFPQENVSTQFNLGVTYQDFQQLHKAYDAFAVAIDTVESLRNEIFSGSGIEEDKQKLAEESNDLYQCMVNVCLELGYHDQAIEYVERSKARNLVELLATRDLYPKGDIPEAVLNELNRLRREIAAEQRRIDIARSNQTGGSILSDERSQFSSNSSTVGGGTDHTRVNVLQQQLNDLITQQIQPIDPTFSLTQRVEPISFQQIQELLPDDKTVLIEWYILDETFLAFIITHQSPGITVWQSSPKDGRDLINWIIEYLQNYAQPSKEHWKDKLESRLNRLTQILHLEAVLAHVPDTCDRVILIPHLFLHLFPLHALPLPNQKDKCLLDKFPRGVRYAPSCQLLQLTEKQKRPDFSYFFGVQNPTEDLFYANLEVQTIHRFFELAYVLVEKNAKKDIFNTIPYTEHLRAAHCVHFSCHGEFNFESPLKSALLLADRQPLTLGEIFGLDLSQCRLVTLSACETGLTDFTSISDEYIGLPSAFLYAGALSVVSSLWAVNDLSTCFLTIKFYENLKNFSKLEARDVAIALNQAQKWLRDLTSEDFEAVFAKYQPQIDGILAQLSKGDRFEFHDSLNRTLDKIQAPDRQPKPFANPYYWAAFTATGV
ncbi:MAG: CHAT domain-containing protein [Symplocastrum torsivum CPER-KK1]|jgi:CHAT domain-containing protein|uniref:CHAT domain-containing protein n=1 Tax=Symplocastrum torsivum CPER-KK1 TaxID=450513 RepID=A0A951UBK6_9CYAN|nr:CHAT domain-containing protein [Symplocastrum torsivum CPER-KK1]